MIFRLSVLAAIVLPRGHEMIALVVFDLLRLSSLILFSRSAWRMRAGFASDARRIVAAVRNKRGRENIPCVESEGGDV